MTIRIGRREFISALGGAAAWPLAARAQPTNRVRRIGSLTSLDESDTRAQAGYAAFRNRLQELGWIIGRSLEIDYRWAAGNPNLIRTYAAELVAAQPDALLAFTTPVVAALQRETRTIPIVFSGVSDPVGSGFVQSLAHPGSNATGWTNYVPTMSSKSVQVLKELAPRIERIAVLFNPITAPYVTGYYMPALEAAALAANVKLIKAQVHEPADIETVVSEFAREPGGGLIVMPDTFNIVHRALIIALADRIPLPAIYPWRYVAREGGFVTYGYDELEPYPHEAEYIDRILKGTNPGDLPVQAPTKFELVINLKTAKALGLTVPATLLATADEVIE